MTNIKNLPALTDGRKYFTEIGYSDRTPWVEIKRTAKTVTLAPVDVTRDPEFTPEIHAGGFVGHCSNQGKQTWIFDAIGEGYTRTIRMTKNGWAHQGTRFIEDRATRFHDFNF